MRAYFKVRNDISVSTLTRIVRSMEQWLEIHDYEPVTELLVYNVKDLRITFRPGLPREVWMELRDLEVENMPRNGIVLVEEAIE